ncbi:MAG: exodeoxyribonuclease VII large subunit [Gammaproteobacteria bacterium]|nr:MAG: exodeoxyribonuclease VII large subunit [Gammaproteobacteria bacterium]PIE37287.1 MAG: exodeoxyribonuclease VII large subunit [Gammaproteobacteria bacterium]
MSTRARKVYTVSRLNQEVQRLLEGSFGTLWVQGEISNLSRPASGHIYFTLKDSQAQIRCAMFRGNNRHLDFQPAAGDAVEARGRLGIYTARGDYQLIVEHMEMAGSGRLQAAYEATLRQLDAAGYFDQANKLPLPAAPRTIGIVSSPTGAALQDVLKVLARRYPQAGVILYPTQTQGAQAAPHVVRALERAARRHEADVLLVVRGGGSLEDLWAYNEVSVAEAMRQCPIPIVAGIGHEVDVTIADHVADLRAPTPSAAAEQATPDGSLVLSRVAALDAALSRWQRQTLAQHRARLADLATRLEARHPKRLINERGQRVDELDARLRRAFAERHRNTRARLATLEAHLARHSPVQQLVLHRAALRALEGRLAPAMQAELTAGTGKVAMLQQRLGNAMGARQQTARQSLVLAMRTLDTVSPLAVLERGYAIVTHDERALRDATQVTTGAALGIRLAHGRLDATVTTVHPPATD